MKSLLLPFLVGLTWPLLSCQYQPPPEEEEDCILEEAGETLLEGAKEGDFEIIEFDGCEYIVYTRSETANKAYGLMAHKGNCKNSIHSYQSPDDNVTESIENSEVIEQVIE